MNVKKEVSLYDTVHTSDTYKYIGVQYKSKYCRTFIILKSTSHHITHYMNPLSIAAMPCLLLDYLYRIDR